MSLNAWLISLRTMSSGFMPNGRTHLLMSTCIAVWNNLSSAWRTSFISLVERIGQHQGTFSFIWESLCLAFVFYFSFVGSV